LRKASFENGIKMIISYYNFEYTEGASIIHAKFMEVKLQGVDIAKVAEMPNRLEDVLKYRSMFRMFGGIFDSVATFVIGEKTSAPGQIPTKDARVVCDTLLKPMGEEHT
jgi:3-dehydroquinate dehydratase-1